MDSEYLKVGEKQLFVEKSKSASKTRTDRRKHSKLTFPVTKNGTAKPCKIPNSILKMLTPIDFVLICTEQKLIENALFEFILSCFLVCILCSILDSASYQHDRRSNWPRTFLFQIVERLQCFHVAKSQE